MTEFRSCGQQVATQTEARFFNEIAWPTAAAATQLYSVIYEKKMPREIGRERCQGTMPNVARCYRIILQLPKNYKSLSWDNFFRSNITKYSSSGR